jgi:hypothetical protein
MKQKITLLTAIIIFIGITGNATVWRVNNRANVSADFTTLSQAISGASANDTIYIEGSPVSYGSGNFTKPLTVIGTGYWLNEHDSLQVYQETSKVKGLSFSSNSQGCVVEGLYINFVGTYGSAITISANNITIRRNHIFASSWYAYYYAKGIEIHSTVSSVTIEQNWIEANAALDNYAMGIGFNHYTVNSIIRNNIIQCDTNDWAIYMAEDNEASSLIVTNNVIRGKIQTFHSSQYNNILAYGTYNAGTDDLNSNNLCNATQYPNENGNQQNVDMSTVFVNDTIAIDYVNMLKTGSPAIGAGVLGVDCGAYGTNDPYITSGMPPIPAIFDMDMNQTIGTATIPVTIKAMSHK